MKSVKFVLGTPYVDRYRDFDGGISNINFDSLVRYNGKDMWMRVEVPNAHVSIGEDENGQEQVEIEAYQNYFCFDENQLLSLDIDSEGDI